MKKPKTASPADGRDETPEERADRNWDDLMQELRVMQTGTQVLTGFLLAVAFAPRFTELDDVQRGVYVLLVALAALATILSLTPVGMHRGLFRRRRKPDLVRFAARIVKVSLAVIAVLTVGVTAFIVDFVLNRPAALTVVIVGGVLVISLWILLPLFVRHREHP
ncbi:MAG: DUF6328 family protein [Actinomycetota bacterium]